MPTEPLVQPLLHSIPIQVLNNSLYTPSLLIRCIQVPNNEFSIFRFQSSNFLNSFVVELSKDWSEEVKVEVCSCASDGEDHIGIEGEEMRCERR